MARITERTFSPHADVYVRRFFVGAGRHWKPGDLFDWRRLAVNPRRARQLFDAGKLMHEDELEKWGFAPARQTTVTAYPASGEPAAEEPRVETAEEPQDDLMDWSMKELRDYARDRDIPTRVSAAAQRAEIRAWRAAQTEAQDTDEDATTVEED